MQPPSGLASLATRASAPAIFVHILKRLVVLFSPSWRQHYGADVLQNSILLPSDAKQYDQWRPSNAFRKREAHPVMHHMLPKLSKLPDSVSLTPYWPISSQ